MSYMPETTPGDTYAITEEEVAYIIKVLDDTWCYLEARNYLPTDSIPLLMTEDLYDAMGVMHNLKGEDAKTYVDVVHPEIARTREKFKMARMIDEVIDKKIWTDTDYFD